MAIKLIAVDMDGTFLNREMTYNKKRFLHLFERMQEKGIYFVAASGNPLPQLQKHFAEVASQMTFLAENGAYIIEKGVEVSSHIMERNLVEKLIATLKNYSDIPFVLCGKKGAYVHDSISEDAYAAFQRYYPILTQVNGLEQVNDGIFKVATAFEEEEVPYVLEYLHGELVGEITPVASGYGFVDLIQPNIHKGRGINLLQERWGISKEESVAFGDSPNDLEMLQQVKYGFAMENAAPQVKEVAYQVIGPNTSESLLDTIESLLRQ